ncbi:uncharacterized protein C22orf15 homolog, partial [Morus bassanus]
SAANFQEMVNLQCHVLILTAHLKKCQCRPEHTGAPEQQSPEGPALTCRGAAEAKKHENTSKPHRLMLAAQGHIGLSSPHLSPPLDCINLDEMGTLMNLSKVDNPAAEFTSKYLQERECYILIRVTCKFLGKTAQFSLCTKKGRESSEATCYESLLENLKKHYPDLADRLQKLSANTQMRHQWTRDSLQWRAQPLTSTSARPTSQSKKSSELKGTPR